MVELLAIQAATATEDGLVSPTHLAGDTFPSEQGSQRVNGAATLYTPQKVLELIIAITAQCAAQGTALQAQAQRLQHELQNLMHCFGRQGRSMGNMFVMLVRQTERQLLEIGDQVRPLAQATLAHLRGAP
jgi:hypothetical protein